MTTVGIVGTRSYPRLDRVKHFVATLPKDTIVVSGGARGVDRTGEETARRFGLHVVSFRPVETDRGWAIERIFFDPYRVEPSVIFAERYPNFAAAAFVRNGYIVEFADEVVAYWDGRSKGTRDSIAKARAAGKLRDVVVPWREEAPVGSH